MLPQECQGRLPGDNVEEVQCAWTLSCHDAGHWLLDRCPGLIDYGCDLGGLSRDFWLPGLLEGPEGWANKKAQRRVPTSLCNHQCFVNSVKSSDGHVMIIVDG